MAQKEGTAIPDPLPPAFYATFTAWLQAVLTLEVGADVRPQLEALLAEILEDPEKITLFVGACKLGTVQDHSSIKIIVAMATLPERAAIIRGLRRVKEIKHHVGQAQPGWIEEELADWSEVLRNI